MSGVHSPYTPKAAWERWLDQRLPLPRFVHGSFIAYPVPRNLNYAYTFGGILTMMLAAQIVTGVAMAMHYAPDTALAFLSVEKIMREEANATARGALDSYASKIRQKLGIEPELVVREGKPAEEIHKLIEDDQDIAILVLGAGAGKEGPGPLVASIAGKGAAFPIPVTVVPLNLSDEDLENLA